MQKCYTDLLACQFQHSAARRRLLSKIIADKRIISCFNTQPRGGGCNLGGSSGGSDNVSTLSRAEAAAKDRSNENNGNTSFNTQPRGGGCSFFYNRFVQIGSFNTQPRGGGC